MRRCKDCGALARCVQDHEMGALRCASVRSGQGGVRSSQVCVRLVVGMPGIRGRCMLSCACCALRGAMGRDAWQGQVHIESCDDEGWGGNLTRVI